MNIKSIGFKDPAAVRQLPTLKVLDKYTIKDGLLGEGAYGKTYLALKCDTDILACKMIAKKNLVKRVNKSQNKQFTQDFLIQSIRNEVDVWGKLKHKNIVLFRDYRQTENNIYFFMEYCADGTLEEAIRQKRFDSTECVQIFKQIVDGCQYLYNLGVIHRDLKPQNIMIHNGIVKIADFGFSKFVNDQTSKESCTQKTSVGTPVYMSPQGLKGQPYSIKCDVWSIGIIFYRLLCGSFPWLQFKKLQMFIESIRMSPKINMNANIKPVFAELIQKMLKFQQSDRIGIKQVKANLERIDQSIIQ